MSSNVDAFATGKGGHVGASHLPQLLESFIVARWGKPAMERQRAARNTPPWGMSVEPEYLRDSIWVTFSDGREPFAVGIRELVGCAAGKSYILFYWRQSGKIESHRWRCDATSGWQHLAVL
jgi:hypothetical protein